MTTAQIKKQEAKVINLERRTSRAQLELDVARSKLDIVRGNYKIFTSAQLKKYIKSKLR